MNSNTLKGDIIGGLTAGLIPLPRAMALGALIFAPLGIEYVALGLAAGLIALCISNMAGALYSGMHVMNNAPYSLSSFMLLAAVELAIVSFSAEGLAGSELAIAAIAALFFTVFLSGGLQVLFGLARVGSIVKYVPYPVLAGLLNGSAIMIMMMQISPLLGFRERVPLSEIGAHFSEIQPLTFLVGIVVFLVTRNASKISKIIPAPLFGIVAGVVTYYGLLFCGFTNLGALIGQIPSGMPSPEFADDFFYFISNVERWPLVTELLTLAFGIAAINSIRSLVVCSAGEALTNERPEPNRELIGSGMGNMLSGLFGGIGAAGSMSSMSANYLYGGRTAISRAVSGIFAMLVLLFLHSLVAFIPVVVLSGILLMISVESIDKWSLTQIKQIPLSLKKRDKGPVINALTVITVTAVLVCFGIMESLIAGFIISLLTFLFRMSKPPIRQSFGGDFVHSNTQRTEKEFLILEKEGKVIRGVELQGALFFGTSDHVAMLVENYIDEGARSIVIDFRRVVDIDCTGAKVIVQLMEKARKSEVKILFSALRLDDAAHAELVNLLGRKKISDLTFLDIASALSIAENKLLDEKIGSNRYQKVLPPSEMDSLRHISESEFAVIKKYFNEKNFSEGERILNKGDEGNSVFYISSGRASVVVRDGVEQYIATLCPGTAFGEMSLLDERVRSTDIVAKDDIRVYSFSRDALFEILKNEPNIAFKIISGLGRELSTRVRISNHLSQNFHSS